MQKIIAFSLYSIRFILRRSSGIPGAAILLFANLLFANYTNAFVPEPEVEEDGQYDYNYADLNERCTPYDPYENFNRKIFVVNSMLDAVLLRPVAKIYGRFTNNYVKARVASFIDNTNVPLTLTNYALQGNKEGVLQSFWRFAINSTLGIGGLFDIAGKFGLTVEPQNFGSTLARYGVGAGPYIVLPIYGGMGARDITNPLFMNNALNPAKYVMSSYLKNSVTGIGIVHYRSEVMPFTDHVTTTSLDPYIAIRDAVLAQREDKVSYPTNFKCPRVK